MNHSSISVPAREKMHDLILVEGVCLNSWTGGRMKDRLTSVLIAPIKVVATRAGLASREAFGTWFQTPQHITSGASTHLSGTSARGRAETIKRDRWAAKNPRSVGWVAALLVVLALLWIRWSVVAGNWADLDVYVRGARDILVGAPLYQAQAGVLPFTYPPFAAVVFTPLHLLSSTGARWLFTIGSFVSYLVAVGAFGWRLRLPWKPLAVVTVAGIALEPFVRTLLLGQVNLYLMALVVVDCLLIRSSHRGWLIGLAAGIKVVPGVFVLYFMLQRDWRSALRASGGFLVTVAIGAVVAPQDSLRYWTGGLFGISHWGPVAVVDGKNQSLIGQLARISHNPSPLMVTALVLSASGLALAIAAAHKQHRIGDDMAALTALAIGGLLASPLSWTHHWVWGVPAILVLVSRRQWVATWLLGLVFAAGPEWGVTVLPLQESLTLLQQVACATYVVAGTALLAMWAFGTGGVTRSGGAVATGGLPTWAIAAAACRENAQSHGTHTFPARGGNEDLRRSSRA